MNKVWTYIISRKLSAAELEELQTAGAGFVKSWTAHEVQLHASFEVYRERIIIVKVNESIHNASGCSIDKLVRFIKELEQQFKIELLNRMLVSYETAHGLEVASASQIKNLLSEKKLSPESIIYNTSAASE